MSATSPNPRPHAALIGVWRQPDAVKTLAAIQEAISIDILYFPRDHHNPEMFRGIPKQPFTYLKDCLRDVFRDRVPIIALCATGIVVRALADLLSDKYSESPVIVVAENGSCVIPILGTHRGGNVLAKHLAISLGVHPAITTASEHALGFALDTPPAHWYIANPAAINPIMARLLKKQPVRLIQEFANADFPPATAFDNQENDYCVHVTDSQQPANPKTLILHPPSLILGIGCARRCSEQTMQNLLTTTLAQQGLSQSSIAAIATVTLKADEPAIQALAERLDVPMKLFTPEELESQTPRLEKPSKSVFQEIGCHSVSEAAALACAGAEAKPLVIKAKNTEATLSIMRRQHLDFLGGRSLGQLHVIGTGPGDRKTLTLEAKTILSHCEIAIGYDLYLDLVSDLLHRAQKIPSPLGEERQRVERAIHAAQQGNHVALICSGDPGIYALATLVLETLESQKIRPQFRLKIYPGITAMQAAAAKLGAPLGHDFLAISLSDLLTPPDVIHARLHAAATGDFVTAIYNPQSHSRRSLLPKAKRIFLNHRPPETPVAICRNLGRDEETCVRTSLAEFDPQQVDMLCIVIIGSSMTKISKNLSFSYFYTPRGYIEPTRISFPTKDEA